MTQSRNAVPQRTWMRLWRCTSSGSSGGAGLVGVDRLVLGRVVLEDAPAGPRRGRSGRGRRRAGEMRIPPSISTKTQVVARVDPVREQRRRDLEEQQREADREDEAADQREAAEPSEASSSPSSVTEKLAETESARMPIASDSPSATMPRMTGSRSQRRRSGDALDVVLDLRDAAVGTAHRHGPARRAAHHHALEHRLTTDRRHQAAINYVTRSPRLRRLPQPPRRPARGPGADGIARRAHRCR